MMRLAAACLMLISTVGAAHADDAAKFFGHFRGSGISENADSIYFAVSVRDLDVEISPVDGGGFSIAWTTVTREGGDPDNPKVKKKGTSITFFPTDRPGVYRAKEEGDPIDGAPVWWSRIDGTSLYTYMMLIEEDGTWQVQKYVRTVSGSGMTLTFERIIDGEQARQVKARLVKVGE
ncbi:MAG: hypothetical protein RIM72_07295 [Alphaproteobacteria bacterium]